MANVTDKELKRGHRERGLETNSLENLKMTKETDKEFTCGLMETNTLEDIKMANTTDKEFTRRQEETNKLENIKIERDTDKGL